MPPSIAPARLRILRLRSYLPSLASSMVMAALTYTIDTQFPLPTGLHCPAHGSSGHELHLLRPGALAAVAITAAVVLLVARISRLHRLGTVLIALLAALLSLAASALAAG